MNESAITRIPRGQFGIRALLVLTFLAALFMWWWGRLPTGVISESEIHKVKLGQTRDEVENLLGRPLEERWIDSVPNTLYIAYRVDGSKPEVRAFVVEFSYGNYVVTGMSREAKNYGMFVVDD